MSHSAPLLRYFEPLPKLSQFQCLNMHSSCWITSTATNKSGELLLFSTTSKKHNLFGFKLVKGEYQRNDYIPLITLPFPIYGMDLWNYKALVSGVCKFSILSLFSPDKELSHHSLPLSMTGRRIIQPQFHHSGTQGSFLTPSLHSVTSLDLETGKLLWLSKESVAFHQWDVSASSTLLACLSPTSSLSLLDTRLEQSQVSIWSLPTLCECLTWSPFTSEQLVVAGASLYLIDIRQPRFPVVQSDSHHAQKLTCITFHSKDMVVSGSRSGAVHVHGLPSFHSSAPPSTTTTSSSISSFVFLGHLEASHPCTPAVSLPKVQSSSPTSFTVVYDQGTLITGTIPESMWTDLGHPVPTSLSCPKDKDIDPHITSQVQKYIEESHSSPNQLVRLAPCLLNAYQFNAMELPSSALLQYVCSLLRSHYLCGLDFGLKFLRLKMSMEEGTFCLSNWKPLIHLLLYPTMYDVDESLELYAPTSSSLSKKSTPSILKHQDVITLFIKTVWDTSLFTKKEETSSALERNMERAHACLDIDPPSFLPSLQSYHDFISLMDTGADPDALLSTCRPSSMSCISLTMNRMYLYLLRQAGYWDEYLFVTAQFCRLYSTFDCAVSLGQHLIFGVFPNMVKEFLNITTLDDASITLLFKQWLLKIGWILKFCPPFHHPFTNDFFNRTMESLMHHACWILSTSISLDAVSIPLWIHQTLHTLSHGPFPNYLFSSNVKNPFFQEKNQETLKFQQYIEKLKSILNSERQPPSLIPNHY